MSNNNPQINLRRALELLQAGRNAEAGAVLTQHLRQFPADPTAHFYMGIIRFQLGQLDGAIASFEAAAKFNPQFAEAHYNLANTLAAQGRLPAAIEHYTKAVTVNPTYIDALTNLGATLNDVGRLKEAEAAFAKVVKLQPQNIEALYNWGTLLTQTQRHADAVQVLQRVIGAQPNHARAHANLALALNSMGRYQHAVDEARTATRLMPTAAEAFVTLAVALGALRQTDEALEHLAHAMALAPHDDAAYVTRGDLLRFLGRFDEAIAAYDQALARRPSAAAFVGRGDVYSSLKKLPNAAADYANATALSPQTHFARGYHLYTKAQMCDWQDAGILRDVLRQDVRNGHEVATPFSLLALESDPNILRRGADIWAKRFKVDQPGAVICPASLPRLRIGYFSPDFYAHAVSNLMVGVLEEHDRSQVEVIAMSYGHFAPDAMAERMHAAFDQFHNVGDLSDADIAARAKALQIDVAVDLAGYTGQSRPGIFGHRAAPIHVNMIGFPGTMGTGLVDYIIGDAVVLPSSQRAHCGEKVAEMPLSFQPNDSRRVIGPKPARAQFGLTDQHIVFCSFNNSHKYNEATFSAWLQILRQVDNSVLLILRANPWAEDNIRRFVTTHGVDANRLVFSGPLPYAEHLARYQVCDLALDTYPFNGGTTTSDALWAGLPVVTMAGEAFAGRMSASLLSAVGLPQLITSNWHDYIATAVSLGRDADRRRHVHHTLAENRLRSGLFDSHRYARALERAFQMMIQRHRDGLNPDHIVVPGA
jgi:protein O-GlcNAc transferase